MSNDAVIASVCVCVRVPVTACAVTYVRACACVRARVLCLYTPSPLCNDGSVSGRQLCLAKYT